MKKIIMFIFMIGLTLALFGCTGCEKKNLESVTFSTENINVDSKLTAVIKPSDATATYKWYVDEKEVAMTKDLKVKQEYFGKKVKVVATGSMNYTGKVESEVFTIPAPLLEKATIEGTSLYKIGTKTYDITSNMGAFRIQGFNTKDSPTVILSSESKYIDDNEAGEKIAQILNSAEETLIKFDKGGNTVTLEYDSDTKKAVVTVNGKKAEITIDTPVDFDTGVIILEEKDVNSSIEIKELTVNGFKFDTELSTKELTGANPWVFPIALVDKKLKVSFTLVSEASEDKPLSEGVDHHTVELFIGKKTEKKTDE